jgi:hypothetical protein
VDVFNYNLVAEKKTENQNDEEDMKLEKDKEKMALQEQINSYIQKIESTKHQINGIRHIPKLKRFFCHLLT